MSTSTLTRTRPVVVAPVPPARPAVAVRPVVAAPDPGRTHLTRRGRLAVVLTLAVLLFGAFSLGRSGAEGATSSAPSPSLEQTVVQPGETLWGVASRIAPGQDPRPVVEQIRRLNDLETATLQVGQQLLLPKAA